jgi:dynein light chain LC8-type
MATSRETMVELANAALSIRAADISEDMQHCAEELAREALTKFTLEKDVAQFLKQQFDTRFEKHWHCIVGTSFGSFVTHESRHFIYFYLGSVAFLLFKAG